MALDTPRPADEAGHTLRPLVNAGTVIGIGMGGFVDGILFHQLLQLHNMLSARVATDTLVGVKVNMVWDGVFHAGVWITTAIGIMLLWRAVKRPGVPLSGRALSGAMLAGFGLFNLVEGSIDHYLLGIHHVYERAGLSGWDAVFLASGVAMIAAGVAMIRTVRRRGYPSRPNQ